MKDITEQSTMKGLMIKSASSSVGHLNLRKGREVSVRVRNDETYFVSKPDNQNVLIIVSKDKVKIIEPMKVNEYVENRKPFLFFISYESGGHYNKVVFGLKGICKSVQELINDLDTSNDIDSMMNEIQSGLDFKTQEDIYQDVCVEFSDGTVGTWITVSTLSEDSVKALRNLFLGKDPNS